MFHPATVIQCIFRHQLQVGVGGGEHRQHPDGNAERDQGCDHRRPAYGIFHLGIHEQNHEYAHEGEEGQESKRLQEKFHVHSSFLRVTSTTDNPR